MIPQINITGLILQFRECIMHLWNTYYKNLPDGWHSFINVEHAIYETLVVEQLSKNKLITKADVEICVAIKPIGTETEILLQVEEESNIYTYVPLQVNRSELELKFVNFFDWNENGTREYQYVMCSVLNCPSAPQYINAKILIEFMYTEMFIIDS